MAQRSTESPEDSWLTLAEIAEELRLSPVTVRSWISKGKLRAKRAGERKWLVRRSDLDRMLERRDPKPPFSSPPLAASAPESSWVSDSPPRDELERMADASREETERSNERLLAEAEYEWGVALELSRMAPPDARFARRIRQIAEAAELRAGALRDRLGDRDYTWTPIPGSSGIVLSYELRPGGNRPGPKDGWERVDRVVKRLGEALEGDSPRVVANQLADLGAALVDVADAIEGRSPQS
jgi:excisionase family DNA binding protein